MIFFRFGFRFIKGNANLFSGVMFSLRTSESRYYFFKLLHFRKPSCPLSFKILKSQVYKLTSSTCGMKIYFLFEMT